METPHSIFQESLAAYALEALDPENLGPLEAHLRTCDSCKSELAAFKEIGDGLLQAQAPTRPPASIRSRLQDQLRGQSGARSRSRGWAWIAGPAVGVLVLMLAVSLASLAQVRTLQAQQAEIEQQNRSTQTFVAMLAYPNTHSSQFNQGGISGSLLVDQDRGLVGLFVWQLPPAQAGKTYQIWLIDGQGQRTSGGFLEPQAGYSFVTAVIRPAGPLTTYKALGVTAEPSGGSPAPTGPKLFGVDF
jgi:anti-sigma-K factor RskA